MATKNDTVQDLKRLREEITMALGAVIDNNKGLQLTLGHCSYDRGGSFTFKLEGTFAGGETKDEQNYKELAGILAMGTHEVKQVDGKAEFVKKEGLQMPPLHAHIMDRNGMVYVITGATRGRKIIVASGGKNYTMKPEGVIACWKKFEATGRVRIGLNAEQGK